MLRTKIVLLSLSLSLYSAGYAQVITTPQRIGYTSFNYTPDALYQAAIVNPFVYQGVIAEGDKIDYLDTLNREVTTLLDEEVPDFYPEWQTATRIALPPTLRLDLDNYLYKTGRLLIQGSSSRFVSIPDKISAELRRAGAKTVLILVSEGYFRTSVNYSKDKSKEGISSAFNVISSLALLSAGSAPSNFRTAPVIKNTSRRSSRLELFLLDVEHGEVLMHRFNQQDLYPYQPTAIRQHLKFLFLN